jgi:nucleolysin TIA-1/TIAR
LDTHANASTAIFALQGFPMAGQAMELSWGTHSFTTAPSYLPRGGYYDMFTMRPPAPVAGSAYSAGGKAGQAIHGWNQYYQNYYSAGHQNI